MTDFHALSRPAPGIGALVAAALALAFAGSAAAQIATSSKITSPVIVASPAQMTQGDLAGTQLDSPVSTFTVGANRYWITSQWRHSGGITHSFHQGGLDNPYGSTLWTKETCQRNSSNFCTAGSNVAFTQVTPGDVSNLWFVNLYKPQADNGELLAFIHEENVGGVGDNTNKMRIGLAWSSDYGNNWHYLGRIISPYGDPHPFNIQGLPYIVKDGYFYIYFIDSKDGSASNGGIAVARAEIAAVIAAARAGNLGNDLWKKNNNGVFDQPGIGGQPTAIAPWGITHTQAVHSSYTGKYYLPLTFMTWGGINSSIKIYESTDAISWSPSPAIVVADEGANGLKTDAGYQYCSIADRNGAPNAETGQYFYLYCMKDPTFEATQFALYRWQINLGPSIDAFRQSDDFGSAQGPYWHYLSGSGGGLPGMLWQGSYWAGSDSWTRIYRDAMHPGTSEMPVLEWTAPKSGTVRIEGTVRDADLTCGDGINVSVMHNSTAIYTAAVGNGDSVGRSIAMDRAVTAGDGVFFILAPHGNNFCDTTRWDPSITYY